MIIGLFILFLSGGGLTFLAHFLIRKLWRKKFGGENDAG